MGAFARKHPPKDINPLKLASLCTGEQDRIKERARKRKTPPQNNLRRSRRLSGSNHSRTLRKSLVPGSWFERGRSTKRSFKLSPKQQQTLRTKKRLKAQGVRGRRLAPEDRKQAALAHELTCCCGCNLPVEWAHLESRRFESTRHLSHLSIPACIHLHDWLDQGKGTGVRPILLEMAKAKSERLTHEDIYETISSHGYYTWLADRTRI